MFNGDSGYAGGGGKTVTGAEKPCPPSLIRWLFPVTVWHWS